MGIGNSDNIQAGRGALFLHDLQLDPPHYIVLFAILMFAIAVVGTYTGQTWGRNGQKVFRAKTPNTFWLGVAAYYAASIVLIGYYLYKAGAFTN